MVSAAVLVAGCIKVVAINQDDEYRVTPFLSLVPRPRGVIGAGEAGLGNKDTRPNPQDNAHTQ